MEDNISNSIPATRMNSSSAEMNATSQPSESKQSSYVFAVFSSMLAVLIILGNSLVITAYRKNTRLRTRTNIFIVSLAVSDLLVGGISVPIWTYLTFVNYQQGLRGLFEFYISFDRFSALASIFHLTAISVERYLAISRPFDHSVLSFCVYKNMTIAAWVTVGLIAVFSMLCSSLPFKAVCTVVVFIVGFVLPAVSMLTLYTEIFRTARDLIERTPDTRTAESIQNKVREERKVALTVSFVTVLFLIAWLPFFVVSMLGEFCASCLPTGDGQTTTLVTFVKWMHYTNSAVNPLVYAFRDGEMRSSFAKFIGIRKNQRYNGRNENVRDHTAVIG